ncbi:DUF6069 family protein [Amycolatopsis albispora]|uniref:Uncharacterized protein n=1 Tax=Amycolatopsis albispora TaxID=1804986 RepID=A0A344KZ91_9PSEU|nr:DUF6069 family protein [Amycolatopsis albispora]AXB41115.1 hypothetical protein A4R43_00125 [Amycolatopsis albispora]
MSDYNAPYARDDRPGVDAGRLWAGGIATAVVAALLAIVGLLIARGLFEVEVLAPEGAGIWGNASTPYYAVTAAVVALLATGLMHLLSVATPAPSQFFGWIMVLVTLIAVVVPLTLTVDLGAKIATALINLVLGLVIAVIVHNTAVNARTLHRRKRATDPQAPTRQWNQPPPSTYYDR